MDFVRASKFPIKQIFFFFLLFLIVLKAMELLDLGCDNTICRRSGYVYGARLFFSGLVLATFGRLFELLISESASVKSNFRFFLSIATGLTVLVAYVFIRSLFNQVVWFIPISRLEIFILLLLMSIFYRYRKRRLPVKGGETEIKNYQWLFAIAIFAALCLLIADRELPREILLSSDPDAHSFFGFQIERFGGVPYHQRDWGSQGFNYPAGSGVILFIWKMVGGLDQRDSLATLPIMFTYMGAMSIAESLMGNLRSNFYRNLILLSCLCMTAAGLLYPLFQQYAHMEGSGRQLGILFVALFMSFAISQICESNGPSWKSLVLPTLVFFVLIVLNPANTVVPGAIIFGLVMFRYFLREPAFKLFFILLVGLLLAGLDPFYHNLIGIAKEARTDTVIYAPHLIIETLPNIFHKTIDIWTHGVVSFTHDLSVLLAESNTPLFAPLFFSYCIALFALSRRFTLTLAPVVGIISFLISLYLVYGFSESLSSDRRYFLLTPYIFFSLSQYKSMILILMAVLIIKRMIDLKMNALWVVMIAGLLVVSVKLPVRSQQDMLLDPRQAYCGAYECVQLDDRVLLRRFEKMVKNGEFRENSNSTPKVLIVNLISQSEIETWIFPVGGGRIYPSMKLLPAAFYYYQGDVDYATKSYLEHVCNRFDRSWLLSKGIQYIFLPTHRENACVSGMEDLVNSEEVVLKQGNAYLLKLRDSK